MRMAVADLELTDGLEPGLDATLGAGLDAGGTMGLDVGLEAAGYDAVRVLVRLDGRPAGWVTVPVSDIERGGWRAALDTVAKQLGAVLAPAVLLPPPAPGAVSGAVSGASAGRAADWGSGQAPRPGPGEALPAISVVVCTRDRTDNLRRCLAALLALDYPEYEIVVVDNAPSDDRTARLVAGLPVRYVVEERPGLDRARNRGVREAAHGIIAYTDDDVCPDRGWLRAVAAAFSEPDVMAVTGLVAPAELETEAQRLFEFEYGGMSHGLSRRVFRRGELRNTGLLWANAIGCGANMSFRREVLDSVGPFDPALDVGTPAGGGGDLDMLHRVVARGHTAVYEPAAVVWHHHRRDLRALRRQLFDNGRGFGAYLITCARNRTVPRAAVARFALVTWAWPWLVRRLVRPGRFPRRLVAAELAGAILSPVFYLAARVSAARLDEAGTAGPGAGASRLVAAPSSAGVP